MNTTKPLIGQQVQVYGVWCAIVRIHPFGTIDVEALDGSGRAWRVSGLAFLNR